MHEYEPDDELEKYMIWRSRYVANARDWCAGNVAAFLNNRLTFQRGRREFERDDFQPWVNPGASLIDNYLTLRGEEGDMWSEHERSTADRVMAAFVSEAFPQLPEANQPYWGKSENSPVDRFFQDRVEVVLEEPEMKALEVVLSRTGRSINPSKTIYLKPKISSGE